MPSFDNLEQPTETLISETEKRAQRYYHSCLQIKKANYADVYSRKALLQLLDLIGGWPIINKISYGSYSNKKLNFQEAFETVHNVLRVHGFFRWVVELTSASQGSSNSPRQHVIKVRLLCLIILFKSCENIYYVTTYGIRSTYYIILR